MLGLKDVSVFSCLNMYRDKAKYVLAAKEVVDWFFIYKISNYQELADALNNYGWCLSEVYRRELRSELYRVRQLIEKNNSKNVSSRYSFEAYKSVDIDETLIERIDSKNCGEILIQGSPVRVAGGRYLTHIQGVPISKMKRLFGELSSADLRNGIYDLFDTGRKVPIEKLVSYVDLYDESVIRMIRAGELSYNDYSLADNEKEEIEIIRPYCREIIDYITSEKFPATIWGNNTEITRSYFGGLAKENTNRGGLLDIRREQFLEELARYLTFDEANNLFDEQEVFCLNPDGSCNFQMEKPLDKFVRKRSRV